MNAPLCENRSSTAASPRERFRELPVGPLIAVEPRLLAADEIGGEGEPVLREARLGEVADRARRARHGVTVARRARDQLVLLGQPLAAPHAAAIALQDRGVRHQLAQSGVGLGAHALETGAGDLAHQRVAEAIDRPPRQEVAFGVEDPIAGGR